MLGRQRNHRTAARRLEQSELPGQGCGRWPRGPLRHRLSVSSCAARTGGDDRARRPPHRPRPRGALCRARGAGHRLSRRQPARSRRSARRYPCASPTCSGAFIARCRAHVSGPGFMFWVFHVHARLCARRWPTPATAAWPRCRAGSTLADELERAQVPLPIVFGHNDLLPANFLDDGDRLWLIDFEYAGFSTGDVRSRRRWPPTPAWRAARARRCSPPISAARRRPRCAALMPPCSAPRCCARRCGGMVSELYLARAGVDYVAYTADNTSPASTRRSTHYRRALRERA